MNAMWYALVQDEQLGPMDFDEVIDFYYKDIISSETLLWREGLSGWLPISHIQEFKELLFQGEFLSPSEPSSGVSGVSDTRVFTEELGAEMRALSSAARPALPAAPALSAAPALRPPTALPAAPVLRAPPSLPSLPSLPARAPLPSAPPALSSSAPLTAPTHISARETDELQARREELEEELLSVDLDLEPEELDLHPAQPPYEPAPPLGDPLGDPHGDSLGAPRPMDLLLTPPPSVQAHQLRGEGSLDDSPSPYSAPSPTPPSPSSLTPAPRPLELRPAAPQRKSPLPWVALSLTGALGAAYGLGLFAPSVGVVTLDPPAATATSPSPSTLLPSPSTPSLPDPSLPDPSLPDPALPDPSLPKLDSLPAPQAGSLAAPLPLPATPPEVELPPPTGEAPAGGAEAGGASGEEEVDFEIEVEELAVTEAPQGGAPAAVARKKPGAPSANRRYKPKPPQKRRASKRSPKPPAAEPEKPPAAAPAGTCCTRDQVNRVVNASLGKIKACAEADAALKGSTVVVSITIMPSGKVENARATSSALRQSPQGGCVVQVVQGLKFPTFAGEPLPIQLPLKL